MKHTAIESESKLAALLSGFWESIKIGIGRAVGPPPKNLDIEPAQGCRAESIGALLEAIGLTRRLFAPRRGRQLEGRIKCNNDCSCTQKRAFHFIYPWLPGF